MANVDKADALGFEDAVGHHLYLVVDQGAEDGVLAMVAYLRGQFAEFNTLFNHTAFAGVFDDDFYLHGNYRFGCYV